MNFDVTINTDDNYIQHSMAMLCSLYENNRNHHINVHVLHGGLMDKSRNYLTELAERYGNSVVFYHVDDTPLQGVQFRQNRPLSMAAYYRLLLSSVLPSNIDKVLYLDCDIIVLRDLHEIFDIELDGYALAASIDHFPYDSKHRLQLHMEADERTFCSGVMLVNLKYWRDNNVEAGLLEYAKRHRDVVYLHDQDVLNYYFRKKWFLLPPKWNCVAYSTTPPKYPLFRPFDFVEYINAPMLYHYAAVGLKPWYEMWMPNKKYYTNYLKLSGYKGVEVKKTPLLSKLKGIKQTIVYSIKIWFIRVFNLYPKSY